MSRPATRTSAEHTGPSVSDLNTWQENADFWVQIIRGNHDRYRTGLTNAAVLNAIGPASGLRILDAGCGEGYMARDLASQGADVLGVDSSANLIQAASALSSTDAASPRFRVTDVTDLDVTQQQLRPGPVQPPDERPAGPRGPITELARVLKPGGRIVILMLHPCFYNDRASRANGDNREVASTYFTQRKVTQQFNVDGITSPAEVTSWHRPLEFYVQAPARRRVYGLPTSGSHTQRASSSRTTLGGKPTSRDRCSCCSSPRSRTASNSPARTTHPVLTLSRPPHRPTSGWQSGSVQTFCTVSRRPAGPLAPPTRRARRRSRWRSRYGGARRRSAGAKSKRLCGPQIDPKSTRAAADLTREPSRRPSSGSCGQARSQPDPQASVWAAAPCQIRRSVRANLNCRHHCIKTRNPPQ